MKLSHILEEATATTIWDVIKAHFTFKQESDDFNLYRPKTGKTLTFKNKKVVHIGIPLERGTSIVFLAQAGEHPITDKDAGSFKLM